MKKNAKKLWSLFLIAAMLVGTIFINGNQIQAASKLSLNKKSINLLVNKKYTLKVNNKISNATYKWKSGNKKVATISNTGVVQGKSKGETTITCTINSKKKNYKLTCKVTVIKPSTKVTISNKIKMMNVGESYTLKSSLSPKSTNDTVTWSTSDNTIAQANSKGIIKAKKSGVVTITAKAKSGKVDTCRILVADKTMVVDNESDFILALTNANVTNLTLATKDDIKVVIPEGNYENVTCTVDAPKGEVTNNGIFKEVIIKNIAPSTWVENAKNNNITVSASNARVVVSENAVVNSIKSESTGSVNIEANGQVNSVVVNRTSSLNISGKSTEIFVVINAEDSKLSSSIKMNITLNASATIELIVGAEGTSINKGSDNVTVNINNETSTSIIIKRADGTVEKVEVPKGDTSTNIIIPSTPTDNGNSNAPNENSNEIEIKFIVKPNSEVKNQNVWSKTIKKKKGDNLTVADLPSNTEINEVLGDGCELLYWFGSSTYEDKVTGYYNTDWLSFYPEKENQTYELNGTVTLLAIYKGNTTYKSGVELVGIVKDSKVNMINTLDNTLIMPDDKERYNLLPGNYKIEAENCEDYYFSITEEDANMERGHSYWLNQKDTFYVSVRANSVSEVQYVASGSAIFVDKLPDVKVDGSELLYWYVEREGTREEIGRFGGTEGADVSEIVITGPTLIYAVYDPVPIDSYVQFIVLRGENYPDGSTKPYESELYLTDSEGNRIKPDMINNEADIYNLKLGEYYLNYEDKQAKYVVDNIEIAKQVTGAYFLYQQLGVKVSD